VVSTRSKKPPCAPPELEAALAPHQLLLILDPRQLQAPSLVAPPQQTVWTGRAACSSLPPSLLSTTAVRPPSLLSITAVRPPSLLSITAVRAPSPF